MRSLRLTLGLAAALLAAVVAGCATYGDWAGRMEHALAGPGPGPALEILEHHEAARDKDAVLYLLNRAMLLRMDGKLQESNAAFEQVKTLIEQLAPVSVSEQAGSVTVNELLRSYVGEPFERALVHVYSALNYLELGAPDRARVEALQLDKLRRLQDGGPPVGGFASYLSGMVFETLGERDDALIDYRHALAAYRSYPEPWRIGIPRPLEGDLLRLAERPGSAAERERYRSEFGPEARPSPAPGAGEGELVFVLNSGLAPRKAEGSVAAMTANGELITVAMPYYESRMPRVTGARLTVEQRSARVSLVEDVNALALATLDARRPAILARAIARVVAKHKASAEARKENAALGFAVNLAGVVSERADTRSWSTLPNRIYLARLPLPAGTHTVHVALQDAAGRVVAERDYPVTLEAGERRFLSLHWIDPSDLESHAAGNDYRRTLP